MESNQTAEFSFENIHKDIKSVLAELTDIVTAQDEERDPVEIAKNNEAFLKLLDTLLNEIKPILESQSNRK